MNICPTSNMKTNKTLNIETVFALDMNVWILSSCFLFS